MPIQIQPMAPEWVPAVQALNARLRQGGGGEFLLPELPEPYWLPRRGDEPLYEEYLVAREGNEVRGGYLLKHQPFWLAGETVSVGFLSSLVSEGLVDSRHAFVGLQLLRHAWRRQPRLFCLGMGGFDRPLPRLLRSAGWQLAEIPFLYRIVRARPFLRDLAVLRRRPAVRWIADALAATGIGSLGLMAWNGLRASRPPGAAELRCEPVEEFGPWVEGIWEAARTEYLMVAVRDAYGLNRLYPPREPRFIKARILRAGRPIGWSVALDTQLARDKYFGNLRLGSIVDTLALPGEEPAVAWATADGLRRRGVDLMITNQSRDSWRRAFRRAGWMGGRSNFIFAAAPDLALRLAPFETAVARLHLNRGDGEGPTHL